VILLAPLIHTYYLWKVKGVDQNQSVIQQNVKIFSFFYLLIGIGALLLILSPKANANEANCYSSKNSDQKNFCLATAKHQGSYCY